MTLQAVFEFVVTIGILIGFSFAFWCTICILRLVGEYLALVRNVQPLPLPHPTAQWKPGEALPLAGLSPADPAHRVSLAGVAVIIPARNEEQALPQCIASLAKVIPPSQVFVASDGSTDRTVQIARNLGCKYSDIQPNGGKARALKRVIDDHELCRRFKAVLILDADSEINLNYFRNALPLFDDPNVVTIAGHQLSTWRPEWFPKWPSLMRILTFRSSAAERFDLVSGLQKLIYTAYRVRLFRVMQSIYQYGQSWKPFSVTYIAPGAASMYRTTVLPHIDITAPGLVIEDFNMTFEVQHKRLGRIAYTPYAMCSSEDPFTFIDYVKQIRRWYLGFWQTVRRHGFWPSKFSLSLALFSAEILAFSSFLLLLPPLVVINLVTGAEVYTFVADPIGFGPVSPLLLLLTYFVVDVILTILVAIYERRPEILLFAPLFPFLRMVDAAYYIQSFVKSFRSRSDGTWTSPTRQLQATGLPHSVKVMQ